MGKRILIGVVLLGTGFLGSGCMRHYYGPCYPHRYAARHAPGSYWAGVGLATAGHAVLESVPYRSSGGTALAAAAVGIGLTAAGASALYHAATAPPRHSYVYRAPRHHSPPRRTRYSYRYWDR